MSDPRELETLVRRVQAATAALSEARQRLAEAARAGTPVVCVDPAWDWARRMLASRSARLRRIPGVVGYGLGCRMSGGVPTREPCLSVYVRRKLPVLALRAQGLRPLPRCVGTGARRIAVDVMELRDLEPHGAARHGPAPQAEPRLWRPLVFPGDCRLPVRLLGVASGYQEGVIESPYVQLPAWSIERAILARIPSVPGDSGAALLDPEGLVIGFLAGRATCAGRELRVFRPAGAPGPAL